MGVPVEAIETAAPLLMHRRELRADSGGAGKFRGGLGQVMELEIITGKAATHSCMYDRTRRPALGLRGGKAGATGVLRLSDGGRPHPKSHYQLQPGQRVILALPGGGGFGNPMERDVQRVLDDARAGYVSIAAAEQEYGVAIDAATLEIDAAATKSLRG